MKRTKRLCSAILLIILLLLATACAAKDSIGDVSAPEAGATAGVVNGDLNRKIVYNVSIRLDADDVTACKNAITEKCKTVGGYVERNNESYDGGECTSASVTYRVPTERLDEFLASIEGQGKVTSKNVGTTDITTAYVNAEAKKSALEERKALLEQLLADSTISASDRIAVISEISAVNTELEAVNLLITQYDSQVNYSTVTVSLSEPTSAWQIALILIIAVFIQVGFPVLIVLGILKRRKKRKERKAKREAISF